MDTALDCLDAYVARLKGPPGRATCKAVADRLRHVEPALADALSRERAALNAIGDLQVTLESAWSEIGRLKRQAQEREAVVQMQAERLDALGAEIDRLRIAAAVGDTALEEAEGDAGYLRDLLAEAKADASEWGQLASDYRRDLDARTLWFEMCSAAVVVSTFAWTWWWPHG